MCADRSRDRANGGSLPARIPEEPRRWLGRCANRRHCGIEAGKALDPQPQALPYARPDLLLTPAASSAASAARSRWWRAAECQSDVRGVLPIIQLILRLRRAEVVEQALLADPAQKSIGVLGVERLSFLEVPDA